MNIITKKGHLWMLFLAMFLFVLPTSGYAQEAQNKLSTITGTITDTDGEPLIGASIVIKGTKKGTIANIDGKYSIETTANVTLVFNYIGYELQERKVGNQTEINVVMKVDTESLLDEVVVIGYGSVRKQDLTGSVVNVKMADIRDVPVMSVDQALQGRIAGADIMATTGEPGAPTSIRIRGTRSITASNEPLIVVDGVMDGVSDLGDINPSDIESISVLKDASSTAIYGSRGANGVIIVTTKQGKAGKPSITLKTDIGFAKLPRKLDIMNATEFAQFRNDYAYFATADGNEEIGPETPQSEYPYPNPWRYGKGTDWVDEITRTALYQNYTLSLSGGTEKTTYYASLAFNDTRGIIDNSGLKRFTGRLNLDHQLFPWLKIGYNYNYTHRDEDLNLVTIGGTNWWNAAVYLSPLIKVDSDFNDLWYSGQRFNSPRALIDLNTSNDKKDSSNNTAYLVISPIKGLDIRQQGTYYTYEQHGFRFQPSNLPAKRGTGEGAYAYRREFTDRSLLSETTVSYKHKIKGGHSLDGLAGFTAQTWKRNNFTLSGTGYLDGTTWNNMQAIPDKSNLSPSSSNEEKAKMSMLARFGYNFKERYYLTATGRRDGASNFAKNRKWAFFPSLAFKWSINNENFFKNQHWVDDMSVRISAGRTGNDGIASYRSLAALGSSTNGYLFGEKQPVAYYPSRLASDDLKWEKTDLYNLAVDLSFLNNRLNITAEGYLSYTKDLLLDVQTPTHTGYSSRLANVGETSNKGVELSIESKNIVTKKFGWTTSLTMSHNKQMVHDIGTSDFVKAYSSYGNNGYMMYGYVKDYPLNALWGFKYGGVWKNQEEIDRNKITKAYVSSSNAQYKPGSARYLDTNHDGIFNERDLVYLGNADPYLHGGIQNTFHIYDFTLGIYFNYSLGGKIYNISEQWMGSGSQNTNQYRFMQNAWHPIRNPDSDIPRAGTGEQIASDRNVYDASFLRLKNISVSYTFDMRKRTKNAISNIRLSAAGENLHVWKKYNGFDPDVSSSSGNSALRRVDIGAYPKSRTMTFSVQIQY